MLPFIVIAGVVLSAVAVGTLFASTSWLKAVQAEIDALVALDEPAPAEPLSAADFEALPAPAQRYARALSALELPLLTRSKALLKGRRRASEGAPWVPFEAWQAWAWASDAPPAMLFGASMKGGQLLVREALTEGKGSRRARRFGWIPAGREQGGALDRSMAWRCLAEAVWVPGALLTQQMRWSPIDEGAAELQWGGLTLRVEVDPAGHLTRLVGARAQLDGGEDRCSLKLYDWAPLFDGRPAPRRAALCWGEDEACVMELDGVWPAP